MKNGTTGKKSIYRPELATATDPRVVQTRNALRTALLALLESEPFEQISVRQIAEKAGIGYITFFRHYPAKEDLLQEIVSEEIDNLVNMSLPALGSSNVEAAALALCKNIAKKRELWTTLLTGGAAPVFKEKFVLRALEVAEGRTTHTHWLPPETAVAVVSSGTIEVLTWWLKQKRPPPIKRVAKIYEKLILEPVVRIYVEDAPI